MEIVFKVPGPPKGKARARTFYNPKLGRMQSITPEGTVLYENLIKTSYLQKAKELEHDGFFNKEPLYMEILAIFSIPKSTSKKRCKLMEAGEELPCKKPDADNIAKVICDALNKVAYGDDTQICKLNISKRYAYSDKEGYVFVSLRTIGFPGNNTR